MIADRISGLWQPDAAQQVSPPGRITKYVPAHLDLSTERVTSLLGVDGYDAPEARWARADLQSRERDKWRKG